MIENAKEVMLQCFDLGKAIDISLLDLQLRWGISMANALELDSMDRLGAPFHRLKRGLISHNERKIASINLQLMTIVRGARRSGESPML